ncbi:MAG: hypothetical protein LBU90_09340 [Bacteroidales bacterium]|jgi:hypothetical protein|nr:hypothetical protein [Bacteroidales bacterium]
MKILSIFSLFLFISCNHKFPYEVASITVRYPNISAPAELKSIRTNRNDISIHIDTITLGLLNSSNKNSVIIPFNEPFDIPNYILFIENTMYRDTISDILFQRNNKDQIINFEYKHNGIKKTETILIIQ